MRRLSHSSANLFQKCPAAWKCHYMMGLRGESGPAAARGSRLHLAAEKFLTGQIDNLPVDFWKISERMNRYKSMNAQVEVEVAVDKDWKPCDPGSPEAKWLSIIDILIRSPDSALIIDLKSGKPYPSHQEQLQLYATMMMSITAVSTAGVAALYIDTGQSGHEKTYPREMQPMLMKYFDELHERISNEKDFAPTPSFDSCRFCSFSARKGGSCAAGV